MNLNFKFQISNYKNRGITLIEILVVVFIIALFSSILIVNFPNIKKQFALTRTLHKMGQDLRRVEDMGLSGEQLKDINGDDINVQGYGLYINLGNPNLGNKKYIIYADVDDNQIYSETTEIACSDVNYKKTKDCVIETIDFSQTASGVIIDRIENTKAGIQRVDINFKPPNPTVTIADLDSEISNPRVHIIFALEGAVPPKERTAFVNTAGLIEIK